MPQMTLFETKLKRYIFVVVFLISDFNIGYYIRLPKAIIYIVN